ncbi:hypothetical protein PPYR_13485 [Photinus pyralis]|uniref:Peptidase S1 domain-containing protein n=1 Tax=Photinus pyralis TaxID=7054 RepID=A0A5N4A964_PHOPY|nr:hypothetical protein PPYR_13485 [Photinus pyralis]
MNACLLLLFVTGTLGAVSPLNYLFGTVPKDEYDWKIVGGSDAPEGAYPYQVSLRSFGSHNCGGSIIDATTVMTAAHCVTGSKPSALRVVVGSNKLNSGGVSYELESIRAHTGYDSWRFTNDIAILKLKTPISFTDKVKSVDLETEYLGADVDCVLSGWGRLNYPGSLPNNLQHIDLKTITSEDCAKLLNLNSVDRTHVCTLTKAGEGACHGDSGGPLVANKQIGIVSFGRPCAKVPKDEYDWKIVGGSDAPEGAYPYQVSLRSFGSHNCGGSIIDATTVMTAAHCVTGSSPSFLRVVAGSNKLNSGGVTYEIESIRAHTGYDSWRFTNDIALLKLKTPISFTDKVKAVDLETEYLGAEVDCILSGWGRLNYPGSLPNNLQHIDLKTITSEDCAKLLNHNSVDRTHICTLTKAGEGACHGDSGGPLVANKQIGIVSFGRPCAKGYPDAFTRVSAFTDWIEKNRY